MGKWALMLETRGGANDAVLAGAAILILSKFMG
jgi:hypothetical protein